ncbi:MAG: hypothetical protein D6785_05555 [Planctomycetota bacterium]|nr:MAG: hypothetical protein D6785_05555 [Planctomycetota bacterium]
MRGKKWIYIFLLMSWTSFALGVGMHYPGDNFNCGDCHSLHGASISPLLSTGNSVEEFCLSCHSAFGPAGSPVGVHQNDPSSGNGFNFRISCITCHDPHRRSNLPNIKNIRKVIEYPTGTFRTIQFTSRHEYVLGNGPGGPFGICEACHTLTAHHTNDGAEFTKPFLDQHYTKTWGAQQGSLKACAACHMHNSSFWKPAGDKHCVDCHSQPQGTRRAIVSEFSRTGAHFALATDPVPTRQKIKQGRQCLVCHDVTEHQKGKVRLKSGDDDTAVIAFTKFTSTADLPRNGTPPPGEVTQDTVMNNFCLKCHDADGASDQDNYAITGSSATALTPFNTNTRVDVDTQFAITNASYHPVKGYINNPFCDATTLTAFAWNMKSTGTTFNCWDCHEVTGHGGQYADMTKTDTMSDNPQPTQTYRTLQETFCGNCHNMNVYAKDKKQGGGTGSHFLKHGEKDHFLMNYSCRNCHAGLVNQSYIADNGAAKGRIHGYTSFTFPARAGKNGTAPVSASKHFLIGGYLSKWIEYWPTGSTGSCWGGQCQHDRPGGGKSKNY